LPGKKDSIVHEIIKKFYAENQSESSIELETAATVQEQVESPESQDSQGSSPAQRSTSNPINNSAEKAPKTELTHSQELFFKRVLHHTALQIFQLGERLQLKEKVVEQVWNIIKYVLASETTLLIDRHIDQLILSTVYGVCKILHEPYKFQEIITKYQELPFFDKNDFTENIHQVYINENERADLIKFYNNVYIPQMKTYLFTIGPQPGSTQAQVRPATPQIKKPLVPALITQSPLREALPHPMMPAAPYNRSISAHAKSKTPIPSYGMTPRTGALYAFGESPSRTLESINNIASKRQIDFDDGPDSNSGDFIMKKAKGSSSILDKIIEQKNEESEEQKDSHKLPIAKKNIFSSGNAPSSSILNKFSFAEDSAVDPPSNSTSLVGKIPFTQLLQSKSQLNFQSSGSSKMSAESSDNSGNSPQQNGQSQGDSPVQKTEASNGFKKVAKKDGSITPEFNKK